MLFDLTCSKRDCIPRTRVRFGFKYPSLWHKETKWSGSSDETAKTEAPCHSRCDSINTPSCSKALSAKQITIACNSDVFIWMKYQQLTLEFSVTNKACWNLPGIQSLQIVHMIKMKKCLSNEKYCIDFLILFFVILILLWPLT